MATNSRSQIGVSVQTTGPLSQQTGFRIRLSNFCRIAYLETQIPVGRMILLDGPSGVGKSSLLEAISFVFYDNAGNSCYNRKDRNNKKHDPTWVELTFPASGWGDVPPGLTIQRQRRPNLLRVIGEGILLEDGRTPGPAQGYLDQLFGSYATWQVGGYIRQDSLCNFFVMNPSEKLGLLQQLSLPDRVDPKTGRLISGAEQFEEYLTKTVEKIAAMTPRVQEAEMETKICTEVYMRHYNQWSAGLQGKTPWSPEVCRDYFARYEESYSEESAALDLDRLLTKVRLVTSRRLQQLEGEIAQEQMNLIQVRESVKQRRRLEEIQQKLQAELATLPPVEQELARLDTEQIDLTKQIARIEEARRRRQQLELEIAREEARLDQYQQLESTKRNLQAQLEEGPEPTDELARLEKDQTELTEQIVLSQKTERRSQLLTAKAEIQRRLDLISSQGSNYTSAQLDLYERLRSGPTLDQIDDQIKEASESIEYLRKLNLYNLRRDLVDKMTGLEGRLSSYPDSSVVKEIEEVGQKIWSLSLQEKKLVCPKCSSSLYLNGDRLTELTQDQDGSIEQLNVIKKELQQREVLFQQRGPLDRESTRLKEELVLFDSKYDLSGFRPEARPTTDQSTPHQLEQKLLDLRRTRELRSAVPDISIEEERQKIQQAQERARLLQDIEQVSRQIDLVPATGASVEVGPLEARRREIQARLQVLRQHEMKRAALRAQIDQIDGQLRSITRPDTAQLQAFKEELESLASDLRMEPGPLEARRTEIQHQLQLLRQQETKASMIRSHLHQIEDQLKATTNRFLDESRLDNLKQELDSVRTESQSLEVELGVQMQFARLTDLIRQHARAQQNHQQLHQRLSALQRIKASLITAEYILLDTFLSQINQSLAEVIDQLFLQPASFTLRSMKQLKTDDRIKPQINYEIVIDGAESSNISEISGGERSRISLALAIVFSSFTNVPFLLLDESLSTLHASIKETTMKVIRHHLANKLVITVNHDTTTGVYDSVVRLE